MKFQELVLKKVRCAGYWAVAHQEIAPADACMQTVVALLLRQMMLKITRAALPRTAIQVRIHKGMIKRHKDFCAHLHHRKIVLAKSHNQHSARQPNLPVGCDKMIIYSRLSYVSLIFNRNICVPDILIK